MKRKCGIYKITSPTGKIYIGQSVDILKRFGAYNRIDCNSIFPAKSRNIK